MGEYRKVSADEDTVERVAEAIRGQYSLEYAHEESISIGLSRWLAKAAINAIGGGDE